MNAISSPASLHLAHSQKPVVPRDRFCRIAEVTHLTGLSKSVIYDLMKKGRFPVRVKFSARASMWKESEVLTWIQQVGQETQQ